MKYSGAKGGFVAAWIVTVSGLFGSAAFAQAGTGVLTGKVLDSASNRPVADVVVTVTSPSLQGEQLMVTDASGFYRLPGLPPGEYTLRVEKEAYKPYTRPRILLRADTTIQVSAELLPETLQEEIIVTDEPPSVDVGSSMTTTTLTSDFTQRVPVSQPGSKGSAFRSFESVAVVAPQARTDEYGTSFNGATSPENQYQIDGLSVNDPAFGINATPLSLEFMQETNVITGGYMPEFGRTTGGFLNAITKSGSNEFHGSIFGYLTPGFLQGSRKRTAQDSTIRTDIDLEYQWDAGFDIGGPLQKDKLWFYAGFDYFQTKYKLDRNIYRLRGVDGNGDGVLEPELDGNDNPVMSRVPGARKTYDASEHGFQYIGKLTYAIDRDQRVSLAAFGMPRFSGGDGQFGISPRRDGIDDLDFYGNNVTGTQESMGHRFDSFTNDVVLKHSAAFDNKSFLLDTTLGWHHQQGGRFPSDGSTIGSSSGLAGVPAVEWFAPRGLSHFSAFENLNGACDPTENPDGTFFDPCPINAYYSGGPENLTDITTNRYQLKVVGTKLVRGAGHHVLKAGLDTELTTFGIINTYSGGRRLSEDASGGYFLSRQYGFIGAPDQPTVQNGTEFGALGTTFGGFVQDSWSINDQVTLNLGLRYDVQVLYNDAGEVAMALPNQWSPRLGAVYDFLGNGRSKVFGHFGRYYESVPLDVAQRALSGESFVFSAVSCDARDPDQLSGTGCDPFPISPTDPSPTYIPVGGGRTAVDPDLKAQSTDEFVLGAEYEIVPRGRLGAAYTRRYLNHAIEDMSRDEGSSYFIGNPGFGIADDRPEARREYDAITVYFEKSWSRDWLALGSYTASWLRGNYAGLHRPENLQLDPNMNSTFDLPSMMVNADGALPGDRRHQIKLFGARAFQLPKRMTVTAGLGYRVHSGDPTNYLGAHPLYGQREVLILPRGSGERLDWVHSIDPHVSYGVGLSDTTKFEFMVDVFNVFNFQTATRVDETYTTAAVAPIAGGNRGDLADLRTASGQPFDRALENPKFGEPIRYQDPLTVRLGARLTF